MAMARAAILLAFCGMANGLQGDSKATETARLAKDVASEFQRRLKEVKNEALQAKVDYLDARRETEQLQRLEASIETAFSESIAKSSASAGRAQEQRQEFRSDMIIAERAAQTALINSTAFAVELLRTAAEKGQAAQLKKFVEHAGSEKSSVQNLFQNAMTAAEQTAVSSFHDTASEQQSGVNSALQGEQQRLEAEAQVLASRYDMFMVGKPLTDPGMQAKEKMDVAVEDMTKSMKRMANKQRSKMMAASQ